MVCCNHSAIAEKTSAKLSWRDTKRLLHFEPQLALPTDGAEKPWIEKPKIILVLGPTTKVGYRLLYHFERRDISQVVRRKDIVRIEGTERHQWADKEMKFVRTFFLLAFDEAAAERVERQILEGKRIHFGLDGDVLGMICRSGHVIHAINASIEIVRRLCVETGLDLRQECNPRYKLKTYGSANRANRFS